MILPVGFSTLTPESSVESNHPQTIVLQPNCELTWASSQSFQRSLEEAIELTTESVIVDLLWVDEIDTDGIRVLVAGIEKAECLGKVISFQAMDNQTRTAMEAEWERQRQIHFGSWTDVFDTDLERFLDNLSH